MPQYKDRSMGKILIIDDDREISETFSDVLLHAGHDVYVANSGAEAFKLLRRMTPDVILLDMQMPDVSGMLTLSYIRHLTRLSHSRIIIVSGHPEMALSAQAVWGIDQYLHKPVSPRQLLDAVAPLHGNQT
jgi:DNA-binding response OmpR family regulator